VAEVAMTQFKVLFQHLSGKTEENNEKHTRIACLRAKF
jgi:hypothetical protein